MDYACNYSIITGYKKQEQNHQLHITEHLLTKCGVPQSVIISPLLFFILTNDLSPVTKSPSKPNLCTC